jgi:hypothetical protein
MFSPRFSHSHHEQDHEDHSVMLLHIRFYSCTCRSAAPAAVGTVQHLSSMLRIQGETMEAQREITPESSRYGWSSPKRSLRPNIMLAAGARITIKTCKVIPLISTSYERYLFGRVLSGAREPQYSWIIAHIFCFSITFGFHFRLLCLVTWAWGPRVEPLPWRRLILRVTSTIGYCFGYSPFGNFWLPVEVLATRRTFLSAHRT